MVVGYLLNRAPTKSLDGKTPYEVWIGRKLRVHHLRTFGCVAYAKRIGPGITKLSDRSVPGVFLGYEPGSKAYRIYDPVNKKLMISRDVIINEKKGWNWGEKGTGATEPETKPSFSVFFAEDEHVNVAGSTTVDGAKNLDALGDSAEAHEPASPVQSIPSPVGCGW